jgi:hypothetical protein
VRPNFSRITTWQPGLNLLDSCPLLWHQVQHTTRENLFILPHRIRKHNLSSPFHSANHPTPILARQHSTSIPRPSSEQQTIALEICRWLNLICSRRAALTPHSCICIAQLLLPTSSPHHTLFFNDDRNAIEPEFDRDNWGAGNWEIPLVME